MAVVPIIDETLCDGCGICVEACHVHAVGMKDGRPVFVAPDGCDYCTECESLCPKGAIKCPLQIVVAGRPRK